VRLGLESASSVFEIARLLVRLDHVAKLVINANHRIM